MSAKIEARREALRQVLIAEGEGLVAAQGLGALKARELAARAGCALGAIYTHFADLDALAALINARTLRRLEEAVAERFASLPDRNPKTALVALGTTYAGFVRANPLLWSAIFELGFRQGNGAQAPMDEHLRLLRLIAGALRPLLPGAEETILEHHARGLFSAVHGIVSLAEQRRFMAVADEAVEAEITFIVEAFCDGLAARNGLAS
ncbi:MAG: TetR family transcriptional regulator [Mesorhizobium amorphae]|nr:MAG: TetR family transcriptional regulator [Mesorhizobium amorphae]